MTLFRSTGIACFLAFIGLYWTSAYPAANLFLGPVKIPCGFFILMIAMGCAGICLLSGGNAVKGLLPYMFGAAYFMLGVLVSGLGTGSGYRAVAELGFYVAIPLAAVLLAGDRPEAFIAKCLWALWVNGMVMAGIGLFRLLVLGAPWMEIVNHEAVGFGSRNLDAFFIMIGMMSGLLLLSGIRGKGGRAGMVASVCIGFSAVFFSFSRGMILSSFLVLVLLFLGYRWRTRLVVMALLFPLAVLMAAGITSSKAAQRAARLSAERFMLLTSSQRVTRTGIHNSVPGRLALIPISFKAIREHPINGLGYGRFENWARAHSVTVNDPHNNFLLVWTELGTIAFFGYLVLAGLPLWLWLRIRRRPGPGRPGFIRPDFIRSTLLLFAAVLTFTSCFTNYITYFGYWTVVAVILPGCRLESHT